MSANPVLGYLFPPFESLRVPRDYTGEPLARRLGRNKLLAIAVSRTALEPAVLSIEKDGVASMPLPAIPTTDGLITKGVLRDLKSRSNTAYLAVSFARLSEGAPLRMMLCANIPTFASDLQFHLTLEHTPERIVAKPKPGLSYRGIRHPVAPVALVAEIDSALASGLDDIAAQVGFIVVRRQLALLQLANIGLATQPVRDGATLLVVDHSQVLVITSSVGGVWEEPRLRAIDHGQADFAPFVKTSLVPALRAKYQQTIVVIDTKTSADVDVAAAFGGTAVELKPFAPPGHDDSALPTLALFAA